MMWLFQRWTWDVLVRALCFVKCYRLRPIKILDSFHVPQFVCCSFTTNCCAVQCGTIRFTVSQLLLARTSVLYAKQVSFRALKRINWLSLSDINSAEWLTERPTEPGFVSGYSEHKMNGLTALLRTFTLMCVSFMLETFHSEFRASLELSELDKRSINCSTPSHVHFYDSTWIPGFC
jgi:hypothetical protein